MNFGCGTSRTWALSVFASVTALATPALADTIIIDDDGGPGVHFTDIPPAIAAAQAGDVLIVKPGNYSSFRIDKGLVMLGDGTPQIDGPGSVVGIPASQRAAVVGVSPPVFAVSECRGTVILQEMATLESVGIRNSDDVRLRGLDISPPDAPAISGLTAVDSRVEIMQSVIDGSWAPFADCGSLGPPWQAESGGDGVSCGPLARVYVGNCAISGGKGATLKCNNVDAGDGGQGIRVDGSSELILTGGSIHGGYGGFNVYTPNYCGWDGAAGSGVMLYGNSLARISAAAIFGKKYYFGANCIETMSLPVSGIASYPDPREPVLELAGLPQPGQPVDFAIRGPAGADATLHIGRPVLVAEPAVVVERLVTPSRVIALGTIPASGVLSVTERVPAALTTGSLYAAQAELVLTGTGEVRRTNSTPIVVR